MPHERTSSTGSVRTNSYASLTTSPASGEPASSSTAERHAATSYGLSPNVSKWSAVQRPTPAEQASQTAALRLAGECAILNQVVQYQAQLDQTFAALSDPTRRGILERLGRGRATISELAEPFGITLTGVKKHVHVLEEAGLVRTEKLGRTRWCSIGSQDLDAVRQWVLGYQLMLDERLDRLGELLERTKGDEE
jgi:DNA-binding transcriptional ArsR family regulator